MSEKNAKLLRKHNKFTNVVRPFDRQKMIEDLIAAGHLNKIVARRERARR